MQEDLRDTTLRRLLEDVVNDLSLVAPSTRCRDVLDVERETKLKMEADQEVGLGLWLACRRETPKSSLRATRLPKFFDLE
jgi:hypothetical protein